MPELGLDTRAGYSLLYSAGLLYSNGRGLISQEYSMLSILELIHLMLIVDSRSQEEIPLVTAGYSMLVTPFRYLCCRYRRLMLALDPKRLSKS
jgi:hypothetical protein